MSWHFSRALVAEYSAATYSDGDASVLSSETPAHGMSWSQGKTTDTCRRSRSGMTYACDKANRRITMGTCLRKNTSMEQIATALFAGKCLGRETKKASSNVAQTLVAGRFKPKGLLVLVLYAASGLYRNGRIIKHALENVARHFAYLGGHPIQWSKSGNALLSSAVRLSQGACGTRLIALLRFLGIQSRNCALILNGISSQGCHGKTTAKEVTNGA